MPLSWFASSRALLIQARAQIRPLIRANRTKEEPLWRHTKALWRCHRCHCRRVDCLVFNPMSPRVTLTSGLFFAAYSLVVVYSLPLSLPCLFLAAYSSLASPCSFLLPLPLLFLVCFLFVWLSICSLLICSVLLRVCLFRKIFSAKTTMTSQQWIPLWRQQFRLSAAGQLSSLPKMHQLNA